MMQWGERYLNSFEWRIDTPISFEYGQLLLRYSSTWWLIRFKLATCKSYLTPVRDTKHGAWLHSDEREDHPYNFFMWIKALLECYIAITEFLQPSPWHRNPSKISVETLGNPYRGLCSHVDSFHCYLAATNQTSRMGRRVTNVSSAMGDSVVYTTYSILSRIARVVPGVLLALIEGCVCCWYQSSCAVRPSKAAGQQGWKQWNKQLQPLKKKVIENASSLGWLASLGWLDCLTGHNMHLEFCQAIVNSWNPNYGGL